MNENKKVAGRWLLGASSMTRRTTLSTSAQRLAPNASRSGILLLVVLSMLTLFLLIGTAFIVSANHYRRTQKMLNEVTQTSNSSIDHGALLNEVVGQLLRDTNNQNSSLRFHSLLRDMYGNDGILAEIDTMDPVVWATAGGPGAAINPTNGQLLQFRLNAADATDQFGNNLITFSPINYAYNGLVLTFLDGPARGQSARIVWHGPLNTTSPYDARLRVLTPRLANGSAITPADFTALAGSRVLINGRPFNGTGAGYNPLALSGAARLNTTESIPDGAGGTRQVEIALSPNTAFFDYNSDATLFSVNAAYYGFPTTATNIPLASRFFSGLGGSDESYDAVDYQNMALASMPVNPTELLPATIGTGVLQDVGGVLPIPSFHRPALINYWWNQNALINATPDFEPNMLRKVMLRPSWMDHPNFTGGNPEFANLLNNYQNSIPDAMTAQTNLLNSMIYGPWDVDNDNDGIRDSVWVNFGAPVRENSDGRLVKPLAAVLVLDMGGRLNINAHGSRDIANPTNFGVPIAGVGNTTNILPQGQGFGPAEISLAPILGGTLFSRTLFGANAGDPIFPNDPVPLPTGVTRRDFPRQFAGKFGRGGSWPGLPEFDLPAQLKMQGVGFASNSLSAYATPPDLKGRYAMPGLNDLGQPVYEALTDLPPPTIGGPLDTIRTLNMNTPYELDLSLDASRGENGNANDGAYSMAEMERILRAYDVDAGTLPARIWDFAGGFLDDSMDTTPDTNQLNLWRTTLTTDSYDLPVPNVAVPEWMRLGPNGVLDPPGTTSDDFADVMGRPAVGASFADLLEYRIRLAANPTNPSPPVTTPPVADPPVPLTALQLREMRKLLPSDLADGLRLDINRPFGNGRDDDGNGVVDEPGENEGAFWASNADPTNALRDFKDNVTGRIRDDFDRDGDGTIRDPDGNIDIDDNIGAMIDRNRDGLINLSDLPVDPVALHNLRRQTMAKDLYVLAMTLVDPLPVAAPPADVQARARKLAQWAINVVDFRDPDNIMTAFEYDVNPFDGWGVDGNLTTTEVAPIQREVVWGAERPELLITETLGWHDRRTEDTINEVAPINEERGTVNEGKDADFDQTETPRGYGFVELYNPWPENQATNRDTYGTDAAGDFGVDLAKVTPARTVGADPDPVWRMVLYKLGGAGKDPDDPELENQPWDFGFTHLADRSVYFTEAPFLTDATRSFGNDGVAFYNSGLSSPTVPEVPVVPPGGYMVVGAGEETSPGSGQYKAVFAEEIVSGVERGILLDTVNDIVRVETSNGLAAQIGPDNMGSPPNPSFLMQADNVKIAIIDQPRRFSFSEPAHGYPAVFAGSPHDIPFDDQRTFRASAIDAAGNVGGGNSRLEDGETRLTLPLNSAGGRTIPGFSWVYLQRLANPTLPWNPEPLLPDGSVDPSHLASAAVNPYLTVDSMGANVTAYNGLDREESRWPEGADRGNFSLIEKFANHEAIKAFASLQRGRSNNPESTGTQLDDLQNAARGAQIPSPIAPPLVSMNLWNPETVGAAAGGGAAFGGFWANQAGPNGRGDDANSNQYNFGGIPDCTLGFLNEPFRAAGSTEKITPETPFPWITWNNRPFANANEIMQVPAFRSSQVLQAFSMRSSATPANEAYDGNVKELVLSGTLTLETDGPYGHLLNFFRTEMGGGASDEGIAGMFRLLDYIHVPSPFVKTETWMNPASFGTNAPVASIDDPRYLRQPPFNRISEYREPGRVNLNTVVSADVWDGGLLHRNRINNAIPWDTFTNNYLEPNPAAGIPGHTGPLFIDTTAGENGLAESRRGYAGATLILDNTLLALDPNVPTFFANPFRSSDAGDLVPLAPMIQQGVNCTTLREGSVANTPLLAADTSTTDYNNSDRNPYFRYQPMTRLSSMTTTRSNVYAVWVTIGFFEVQEVSRTRDQFASDNGFGATATAVSNALYDKVYPEGYELGQEAGSETGDFRRVREFAVVDRTVPVAFEPGKNHNVDKAIRLRRRIE